MTRSNERRQRALGVEHAVPRGVLRHAGARLAGIALGLVALYALLPLQGPHWWIGALVGLAAIGAIVPITAYRVHRIRESEYPNIDAVEALLVLFTALVIGFGALYLTIDRNGGQFAGMETRIDAVYFTVTTLSTVGFGDITAVGQTARIAVVFQIVLDFSLLAFGAKLVLGAARQRVNDRAARLAAAAAAGPAAAPGPAPAPAPGPAPTTEPPPAAESPTAQGSPPTTPPTP